MNSTKLLFAVALIAFCCINFGYSLKCYACDTKSSCRSPQKYNCNASMANNTRVYLDAYHTGVNLNTTSPYFECFSEYLKYSTGESHYKGCIYQNMKGCNLPLRGYIMNGKYERTCNQCSNKDNCNPAGRASINILTIFATIFAALILRYVWN